MNIQFDPQNIALIYLLVGTCLLIGYGAVNWIEAYNQKPIEKRFSYEEKWPRWLYNLAIVAFMLLIADYAIQAIMFASSLINSNLMNYLTTEIDYENISRYYLVGWFCIYLGVLVVEIAVNNGNSFAKTPVSISVKIYYALTAVWLANLVLWILIGIMSMINERNAPHLP